MGANRDPLDLDLIIPKPDLRALIEGLRIGRYNLTTVIGRLNLFVRDTLGTLEEFAEEQVKINLENKIKIEKLDRSVSELTEQIQSMRQTLVFKDELVEEKKREIERYRVICEMTSNVATPNSYNNSYNQLNSRMNNTDRRSQTSLKPFGVRIEASQQPKKERASEGDDGSLDELIDSYYSMVNCPTQRSGVGMSSGSKLSHHHRHKQYMEIIGGVNIKGPSVNPGPVPLNRLMSQPNSELFGQSQAKKVNIDLTNQNDAILSSAENIAQQIRHKIHEKASQRQVARGSFDRLSSRRKKQWPF